MEGFYKIAAACPMVALANPKANAERIGELYRSANRDNAALVVFPELSLTGYSCGDLFFREDLRNEALAGLQYLIKLTSGMDTILVCGLPLLIGNDLYNVAAIIQNGHLLGIVPKTNLPNYAEYYECRQFTSASRLTHKTISFDEFESIPIGNDLVFSDPACSFSFGVEICEDLWVPNPVSSTLSIAGAKLIVNLSASTEFLGKSDRRRSRVIAQSSATEGAYALAAAGCGESTSDTIFGGQTLIADGGNLLAESALFPQDDVLTYATIDFKAITHRRLRFTGWTASPRIDPFSNNTRQITIGKTPNAEPLHETSTPFLQAFGETDWAHKVLSIQAVGLGERMRRTGTKKAVIGVSGGADSGLALLGALKAMERNALPPSNVIAIIMPGYGSTNATQSTAATLARELGCDTRIIDIKNACECHFKDIGHANNVYDLTFENVQARERTQILMDVANAENGLVIGTGDLSEIALGWSTYNGDHMSMYALNASIPKTMVYAALKELAADYCESAANELKRIAATPASPELVPGAPSDGTESRIGPYAIHDFLLFHTLVNGCDAKSLTSRAQAAFSGTYNDDLINKTVATFLRRFRNSQFKRNCVPDGPKITLSLSPRADWRMPSDIN